MTPQGKVIICSAPSGSGKSTIIHRLIERGLPLTFSVSATSRPPREGEVHGREYYFIDEEEFRRRIEAGDFLEHEEVYPGRFYGTLKSEVDQRLAHGEHVLLDIDVVGGLNVKRIYGAQALTLFIKPPTLAVLRERLIGRASDSLEVIEQRLSKAEYELSYAPLYDQVVINDCLETACDEAEQIVRQFISTP